MQTFVDFDAWGEAVRGADLRLACDGVERPLASSPRPCSAMATDRLTEEPNNRDTPTTSGEIDTTKRHHFRPPRAAVFNRRQQQQPAVRETTVTQILTAHGIWEFGRFAARYRRQFGESLSDTRRAAADGGDGAGPAQP